VEVHVTLPTHHLALDIGAESGRAMLGQLAEGRLTLSEVYRFPNGAVRLPDGLHWDVLRIWTEVKHSLTQVIHDQEKNLVSLGIDTWGVDFGLLDRNGALISAPYHYRDSRTDGMPEEAFRRMPCDEIYRRTGMPLYPFVSLCQLLSMVVNDAPALEIAETLLTTPDLLYYWLTGKRQVEFTIACTTVCYNPHLEHWDHKLLARMGIPVHLFPPIVKPGTKRGQLLPYVATEVGSNESDLTVVTPACHDTASAVAAVPTTGSRCAWISSGTWSVLGTEMTAPITSEEAMAYNFASEGGVCGTFLLCLNVMGLWIVQECRRTWAEQGEELSYTELTQLAEHAAPFQAVIDPDHGDFFKLGDMPARIQAYCQQTGQPVPLDKGAVIRCVLESLALKYRWALERLGRIVNRRWELLHIVGGGTQNKLLNQLTANATGCRVLTGPVEATALGNVLMQLLAIGQIDSLQEGRALIRHSFSLEEYEPCAVEATDWNRAYDRLATLVEG
jgi:rhamnulokinase